MNDLATQIKKLQLLDCIKHQELGTQLNVICMHSECPKYLEVLCSECVMDHPKHDSHYLHTFKKIMIQLTDLFLQQQQQQGQAQNQQNNLDQEIIQKNQKAKESLLTLAKEFKILEQECNEIYNQINSSISSIFENPQEKIKDFEEFLTNINKYSQKDQLQNMLRQFQTNIKFENKLMINFSSSINYSNDQQSSIQKCLQENIFKINQQYKEFQQKAVIKLKEFQQNPFLYLQQEQMPTILQNFVQQNISDFQTKKIEKIHPRFSDNLHNVNCQIKDNGKTLFHNTQTRWDYALMDDNLQQYSNKIVYFTLNCGFTDNSWSALGIIQVEGAKKSNFYNSQKFSYRMWTNDKQVYDLGNKRDNSGFILDGNKESQVYYMFDSYSKTFYLINQSDGKFVQFQPDLSSELLTWYVACGLNTLGDTFKII